MTISQESADLLDILTDERKGLLSTVRRLTDQQARHRSTVSELTLGGLIKHVGSTEGFWASVMRGENPSTDFDLDNYRLVEGETLAGAIAAYEEVAAATDRSIAELDLGARVELPRFPWSPPEPELWTVRRIVMHICRETAHHSGHADIIREAIDGANMTAQLAAGLGFEPGP